MFCKHFRNSQTSSQRLRLVSFRSAMVSLLKLEHSNVSRHQATFFQRLQRLRKEGQHCDVVLKSSSDGTEHWAHKVVLCAASEDLQNMLAGPFREAIQRTTEVEGNSEGDQAQRVEMAASDAVVFAFLQWIYDDQPEVELEDAFALLRLADAYNLPELAAAIKASIRAFLDSDGASVAAALKVLNQTQVVLNQHQDLHELKTGCEAKVAENFAMCIELADFFELSAEQLSRILQRSDLKVPREEVVFEGLMNWFAQSPNRGVHLPLLLQNIDFRSLSSKNLARLGDLSAFMGPMGHGLQRDVGEAFHFQKKSRAGETPEEFRPKRRCLRNWSPDFGASLEGPQKIRQTDFVFTPAMCWHDGAIYYVTGDALSGSTVFRWKPGDAQSQPVAGSGARVSGENVLGLFCKVSVSPEGKIFVADFFRHRLLKFENGSGNVLLSDVDVVSVFCTPNGAVYVLTQGGLAVEKLVGETLQPVLSSTDLPAELQFKASAFFVTKEEAIYISDRANCRILGIKPGEGEPVVVGEAPNKEKSCLNGLFVTEDEKIYVADCGQQKVWAFHPGDMTWTEAVACTASLHPCNVLVQGTLLYVSIDGAVNAQGIYQYLLPPDLPLERYRSALTCCQIPSTPA